jgi:hypothetical protein
LNTGCAGVDRHRGCSFGGGAVGLCPPAPDAVSGGPLTDSARRSATPRGRRSCAYKRDVRVAWATTGALAAIGAVDERRPTVDLGRRIDVETDAIAVSRQGLPAASRPADDAANCTTRGVGTSAVMSKKVV